MQAKRLPAARGWFWFVGGLKLWQRNPAIVGLAAMLSFLLSGLVGSVPWIGSLLICLIGPFLDIFLLHVCHAVSLERRVNPKVLTSGFVAIFQRNGNARVNGLLILGVVTFVGLMLGKGLMTLVAGESLQQIAASSEAASATMANAAAGASLPQAAIAPVALPFNAMLALLFNLLGISVLSIVMWIAPALTAFADVPPVKSLFFSVIACWRNKAAFLVFGLSLAGLSVPLSIIMLFGGVGQAVAVMVLFGVLMPACLASNYLSLTDIFGPLQQAPRANEHDA
ncbi:BPSS1780 family membrane protein [Uliginosibacterium sp. H3]|uniref:BPSS1780 family membrane protein n=1 Tax=Uliginosibacterium silvisoli TaxID=3114758 RepID=A0ABU6K2U5_9RHOO|nr:BPSS1780 family membrane protein [Uliginosibacterium sp. H3]